MSQPPYPTAPGAPYPSQPAGYGTTPGYPQAQPGYPPAAQQGYPPSGSAPYPGAPQQGYPPAGAAPPPAPYPPQQGVPSYQQPVGAPAGAAGGLPPAPARYVDQPTFKGETSADVVKDDPNLKEPQPSAPPIENMDHINGYDGVTFGGGGFAPPPSYDDAMRHPPPDSRPQVTNLPVINEDQAREALLQYVAQNCCYGSGAAKNMTFRDLKFSSAFHYTLETFAESRSTAWAYEPFKGQPIDSPNMGPAPLPWDISVNPGDKFIKKTVKLEVPHTASVKPCHTCAGVGRTRCYRCHGRGQVICSSCSGRGRVHDFHHDHHHHHHDDHHHHHHHHGPDHKTCTWCHGTGRRRCYTCHGHGQVNCKTCDARGQLKCFIQLTVTWNNHFEDHIVERTALPSELIRDVQGQLAFEEEHPRVWPINHFPDQQINSASNSLVQKHNTAFPTERILKQRHRVRIVPVTEAIYEYKGKTDSYYVYGFENKIYAPKYPETCCCGCTIL